VGQLQRERTARAGRQYEGSVAVVIDIGEHKRLEQSLRDQADRLELALQTGRLGTGTWT
jgi:hypothetical protein